MQTINGSLAVDGTITYKDQQGASRQVVHIPRAATVVIGLAEQGYTADDVDILIQPTDDLRDKFAEAIDKLGSGGGEIKLLEGAYDFKNNLCNVGGDTNKEIFLSGCGSATKLKRVLLHFCGGSASNFSIEPMESSPDVIWFSGNRTKLKLSDLFFPGAALIRYIEDSNDKQLFISNCDPITQVYGRNANNWQNIYINGVAEYVVLNTQISKTIPELTQNAVILDGIPNFSSDTVIELRYDSYIVGWAGTGNVVQMIGTNPSVSLYNNLTANAGSINNKDMGVILAIQNNALIAKEYGWTTDANPNEVQFNFQKLTLRRYLK